MHAKAHLTRISLRSIRDAVGGVVPGSMSEFRYLRVDAFTDHKRTCTCTHRGGERERGRTSARGEFGWTGFCRQRRDASALPNNEAAQCRRVISGERTWHIFVCCASIDFLLPSFVYTSSSRSIEQCMIVSTLRSHLRLLAAQGDTMHRPIWNLAGKSIPLV